MLESHIKGMLLHLQIQPKSSRNQVVGEQPQARMFFSGAFTWKKTKVTFGETELFCKEGYQSFVGFSVHRGGAVIWIFKRPPCSPEDVCSRPGVV